MFIFHFGDNCLTHLRHMNKKNYFKIKLQMHLATYTQAVYGGNFGGCGILVLFANVMSNLFMQSFPSTPLGKPLCLQNGLLTLDESILTFFSSCKDSLLEIAELTFENKGLRFSKCFWTCSWEKKIEINYRLIDNVYETSHSQPCIL